MRDVTDNVTGELDVEVKRGRGRPRKEGALSNAQRQAAFRARRRAESVTVSVTKTPRLVVDQVDAYDECRVEVDSLRVELVEARERIEALGIIADDLRGKLCQAEMERDAVIGWGVSRDEGKLKAAVRACGKTVTASNGNPVPFQDMIELLLLASKARTQDQRDAILESGSFSAVFKNAGVSSQELQAVEWALSAGKRASQVGV